MSTASQPATSSVTCSADAHTDLDAAQASTYAQTLLAGTNVNPAALREALRCCQLALDKKTEEARALRSELLDLQASISRAGRSSRRRVRGAGDVTGTSLEIVKDRINKDVRALAAMHFLWLGDNSFQQAPLLSNPFPSVSDRYFSEENLDLYHTYVLYSQLHQDYHAILQGQSLLKDEVQYLLLSERSTLVHNIRNVATDIFFGCPSIVAQSVSLREQTRARERECLRFLIPLLQLPSSSLALGDPKPAFKYLELPPMLFPELDTSRAPEIFRSDILIQVARCIIFGEKAPGRAIALQQGQLQHFTVSPNCLACQRNITKTSPGLIAAAAILASFVISGDPVFSEVGSETGAAYRARYFKYKYLLKESWEAGEPHTIATFEYWNQQLFGESNSGGEFFDFNDDTAGENEMESHRRAILQSQTSPAPPLPVPSLTSCTSLSTAQTCTRPGRTATSVLNNSSTHPLARSDAVVTPAPHSPDGHWGAAERTSSSQVTPSSSPTSFVPMVPSSHSALAATSSIPILASQPGSMHHINQHEDGGNDTDVSSNTDIAPPTPAVSRSPVLTPTETTSHSVDDHELIQQFHAQMNLTNTQLSAPGNVIMPPSSGSETGNPNPLTTQPQVRRRGRPARVSQSTQQAPGSGSSTRRITQPAAAAPTEVRARLRNRANIAGKP